MAEIVYPFKQSGPYWLIPSHLWRSRRKLFRSDFSNCWRYSYKRHGGQPNRQRSMTIQALLGRPKESYRFLILGDTGEGDRSQYSLLPLIKALNPDFMVINGDVAYPAGNVTDYETGFFEPYKDLGIPIWAVPGNHEYYSRNHGEEFHEVFCSRTWQKQWRDHGLRLVPQPGTYWELTGDDICPLTILGLDSGKTGGLDGSGGSKGADDRQHQWLGERLRRAAELGRAVIVFFHIPGLANQKHAKETALSSLHRIVSSYPAVKLVITAHEHSFQLYDSATFRRYLEDRKAAPHPKFEAEYWVNGGGGAYVTNTKFRSKKYPAKAIFPRAVEWNKAARMVPWLIDKAWLTKTSLGSVLADKDSGRHLSLILVEMGKQGAVATPVWLDDLKDLYPAGARINVADPPPISEKKLQTTLQSHLTLQLH